MNKNFFIGILVVLICAAIGVGAYFFFIQKEEPTLSNTNTKAEDINTIGTHVLTEAQKNELGISANEDATLEAIPSDTSPGATIRMLNVAPDQSAPVDSDGDGLSDIDEEKYGTDPNTIDTDGDIVTDNAEILAGLDPKKTDTLGDGQDDYVAISTTAEGEIDADKDGLSMKREKESGTDPLNPDSDGDGFTDGIEVDNGHNPLGA